MIKIRFIILILFFDTYNSITLYSRNCFRYKEYKCKCKRPTENIDAYLFFKSDYFNKFYDYTIRYYDEDENEYRIFYGGKINADLYLETIDQKCANEIKQK